MILRTIGVTNTCSWHVCDHRLVSHYITIFLLWLILQNVTDIVMTNSGWNKIISASRALLRRSEASLNQLVRPSHAWWHCVQPTRVQSLGRDIFNRWSSRWSREICGACEWFQETSLACFLALFDPTDNQNRHRQIASLFCCLAHAPSIFQECRDYRRQKCHDQVSDQELSAN